VLAAAGYNFRRLLAWLRLLLLRILIAFSLTTSSNPPEIGFFTADELSQPQKLRQARVRLDFADSGRRAVPASCNAVSNWPAMAAVTLAVIFSVTLRPPPLVL
jgi:hypothetical protein